MEFERIHCRNFEYWARVLSFRAVIASEIWMEGREGRRGTGPRMFTRVGGGAYVDCCGFNQFQLTWPLILLV